MTEDAKRVLLEYADGARLGPVSVRALVGGTPSRARRAIISLVQGRLAQRIRHTPDLFRLTPLGQHVARAAQPVSEQQSDRDDELL